MRQFLMLAAVPFVFGCARQSVQAPHLPTGEPLEVRLFQPTGNALNYSLSEPAYVAIFSVTRGYGIGLVYPFYESQVDHRRHAGLNQELVHSGTAGWGYTAGVGPDQHRALFGRADAYFIVASREPLPVEGFLQSPYLLRSLMGADLFRATNFADTWTALQEILVAEMPDQDWATDVYLNWRDPFTTAMWEPFSSSVFCGGGRFLVDSRTAACRDARTMVSFTPPQVAERRRLVPPEEPRDRNPQMPASPPRIEAREPVVRATRATGDARVQPRSVPQRAETRRAEPTRVEPSRTESKRAEPQPDTN